MYNQFGGKSWKVMSSIHVVHVIIYREFKKTTTATATGTSLNKRLISRTMAVHVRYNSWYIS